MPDAGKISSEFIVRLDGLKLPPGIEAWINGKIRQFGSPGK